MTESLKELIELRRQSDRTVDVWVQADTTQDPPHGTAAAARIADMLADDDSGLVRVDADGKSKEIERGDVIWFRLEYERFYDQLNEVRESLSVGRVMESPVIIQADDLPKSIFDLVDVRVVVPDSSGIETIYRLKRDDFGGETYHIEMLGLST